MTIQYHGTPISPNAALDLLEGRYFCVSYARPDNIKRCHALGKVMIDNGAYSMWRRGISLDWSRYYSWLEPWLDYTHTWGVIPDVIDGAEEDNKRLVMQCPFDYDNMQPVWHLNESIDYLKYLVDNWPRICFGSSGQYANVGSSEWHKRITEAFDAVWVNSPQVHMLRGLKCSKMHYPFYSVDSTYVARNHHAAVKGVGEALEMVKNWDLYHNPLHWRNNVDHNKDA